MEQPAADVNENWGLGCPSDRARRMGSVLIRRQLLSSQEDNTGDGNIAGAGTTLNTFLQDSADGIGFNDRLSMTQATTAAGAQNLFGTLPTFTAAALTATANSAVVSTEGALAAGSGIAGPLGPIGRIKFVVVGAAAAVTVTFNVACR